MLKQKCESRGLEGVKEVDTHVRASQYNHQTDTCIEKALENRWNIMPDGERIQRDLYSAFLLQHCKQGLPEYNRKELKKEFGEELYRVSSHDDSAAFRTAAYDSQHGYQANYQLTQKSGAVRTSKTGRLSVRGCR